MTNKIPRSSELLIAIKKHKAEYITFGELVSSFREGGFSLMLIIFSAPTALPLPALPGITFILSLPILFLSSQLVLGLRSPWIPDWLAKKKLKMSTLSAVIDKLLPFLYKIEGILKPRIKILRTRIGEKFIGIVCVICAVSVAAPFPFTNTVPSMGIVIMSIGLLERDGIVTIAGMIVGAIGVIIATSVYYFGYEVVSKILSL